MKLPKPSLLLVGFLIIAVVSGWLNLKNAAAVDAFGDVVQLKADISEYEMDIDRLREVIIGKDTKEEEKKQAKAEVVELEDEIKSLRKEVIEQRVDAEQAAASIPNGSWIWTLLVQIGATLFGTGLVLAFTNESEDSRVRSTALLVLGAITIFILITRILGLTAAGVMSGVLN